MPKTAEETLHILLLDDHALFRESVSRLLGQSLGSKLLPTVGRLKRLFKSFGESPLTLFFSTSILVGVTAENFSHWLRNRDSMERFSL